MTDNENENPHRGVEFCAMCHGATMIPSDDPDGDVMNTPCPECNEWSTAKLYRVEYGSGGGNRWLLWKGGMTLASARALAATIETQDTRIVPDQS